MITHREAVHQGRRDFGPGPRRAARSAVPHHVQVTPPAEGSTLDRRTLSRALLARQLLLDRVAQPTSTVVEHLVGMQAQVPVDPYISLWSRVHSFQPSDLEQLLSGRRAVRTTLMRTTIHLVTSGDARVLRDVMQDVCERAFRSSPFARNLQGVDIRELRAVGSALLAERPCTGAELRQLLAERWPERDPTSLAYGVRYLVPAVQVPPRGLWRRAARPRWAAMRSWLDLPGGAAELEDSDTPERGAGSGRALEATVLRYLRAFGPATAADIRTWSWLTGLRPVLERLRPMLRAYRDEMGRELLDVSDGVFAESDLAAPVRFLGQYDNLFLSHADRSRVTGDLRWGSDYVRKGAFFVDGFLAGAWQLAEARGTASLTIEPRRRLGASERYEVAAEGEALLRFLSPGASGSLAITAAPEDVPRNES
jgi:DNA glycosylase AlkZ-like